LPLLTTFLKSYARPFLGTVVATANKQISVDTEPGSLSASQINGDDSQYLTSWNEDEELVEQDVRDRYKKMCEGYFDNVCKKLVIEHKVVLSEQGR